MSVDERSMREIDLLPFEIAVKESGVGSVMCAYNKVNGIYACENSHLLDDILKSEWGFKGWVMSDWGATHSTTQAANAGLDQEFWEERYFAGALKSAVEKGEVSGKANRRHGASHPAQPRRDWRARPHGDRAAGRAARLALPSRSASPKAASSSWRTATDCCRFGRRA